MSCVGWARRCVIGIIFCGSLAGCFPAADAQMDEQKEPHFIRGKKLVNQMDYTGAIEEFEKALDENPHNASARFELGWLYEDKVNDYAAAIYNYERYLKNSSTQDKADLVKQHINSCTMELAKSVTIVGSQPSGAQRELDRITLENRDLRSQLTNLQAQLNDARAALTTRTQTPPPNNQTSSAYSNGAPPVGSQRQDNHGVAANPIHLAQTRSHTYMVKSGDTLAGIARRNGTTIEALIAANPRVKPSHLLVGQSLNIPTP